MFRDSRGVVHTVCSAEPLADLPPGAALALQQALLVPADGAPVDLGSVLERCDAVRELLERWQDAFFAALPDQFDVQEEARWAAEAGMSLADLDDQDEDDPFEVPLLLDGRQGDPLDDLHPDELDDPELAALGGGADPDDPRPLLGDALVGVLERELLLLPMRVRLEALVAGVNLVSTWTDLVADHEKMFGHLVLAHDSTSTVRGHEHLVDVHARLHAGTGPGHTVPDP